MDVEFYEVKGSYDTLRTDSWRIGFFRNKQKAENRMIEEAKNDKKLKLRNRRYFIVNHVFCD